ncbi:hypothetical protein E4U21_001717 [Claviceps maximensis]|nr:hypothetical protein E4U21_001717 [Claviceps maximensis]
MVTMEVCYDGMTADGRHLTQEPLFQESMMSGMNPFAHYDGYNGYNDSTFALQDCFPAIQEIMTPVAGLPVVDPFSFVSDPHCHQFHSHHQDQDQEYHHHHHHHHHPHPRQEKQQQQQPQQRQQLVFHGPYYQNEQQHVSIPGQENSSNASPELEIPSALARTTLTWVPTPTPMLPSPAPSPPFRHDRASNYAYSPVNGDCSSQPKLERNTTRPKRGPTEKKSTSPLAPRPVTTAASTGSSKKKRPQKSAVGGSKKSSMTSRMKSKEWLRNIESISKQLEAQYDNLKAEHERLLQETLRLKSDLICHAKCRDARLDAWINNEARKFVSASGRSYADGQHSPTDWGMANENRFGSMPHGAEQSWSIETI